MIQNKKIQQIEIQKLYRFITRLNSNISQSREMPIRINHDNQQVEQEDYNLLSHESEWHGQQEQGQDYGIEQEQQRNERQVMMLQTIKLQLIDNNIITQQQLQKLLTNNNNTNSNYDEINNITHNQQLYTIITHLAATIIQHNQHTLQIQQAHNSQILSLQQTIQASRQLISANDQRVMTALSMLSPLTQELSAFTRSMHSGNSTKSAKININISNSKHSNNNKLPIQLYKHFRHVYEFTQQLLNIFNQYEFTEEDLVRKRAEIIDQQIKTMEELMVAEAMEDQIEEQLNQQDQQQEESLHSNTYQPHATFYPPTHPHPTNLPVQTSNYILSLRQQITHLHQSLLKSDQQFTQQIQKYNLTIKQLSQRIKSYEKQMGKMIHYELRIQELEKEMVIFREDKYKNQIVIDNMAKRIRNYQRELKGEHAFISPHRQRLVSSPDTKFSALNSHQSVINSANIAKSMSNSTSPYKQTFSIKPRVPKLNIGALHVNQ